MNILDQILENYPEEKFLMPTGFNDACIGIETRTMRLIYSVTKTLEIIKQSIDLNLLEEDDDIDEIALEHFEFNVNGAWMGKRTPIWCDDDF